MHLLIISQRYYKTLGPTIKTNLSILQAKRLLPVEEQAHNSLSIVQTSL
jgi:hypothetical protein